MIEMISLVTMAVGVALLFVAGVIWFVTRGLHRVRPQDEEESE